MAIEADLKELYDAAYSPLSAEAHAEWMVLRRSFLKRCEEPSHKSHWLPVFHRPPLQTGVTHVATGYFVMMLEEGAKALGLEHDEEFWAQVLTTVAKASEAIAEAAHPAPERGPG
jgi:hypothetical protein